MNTTHFLSSEYMFAVAMILLLFLVLPNQTVAQSKEKYLASVSFDPSPRNESRIRILFYNVENLFDYFDDSTTVDEAFTPLGEYYWNKFRYQDKLNKLAKTILAIGGWEPPAIIGLCEIENRYVLESLTNFTQLKRIGYEIIHQDSRDRRGIDVAAIYRPDKFELLNYEYYSLNFPFDIESRTRDILHVVGRLPNQDTLHYFVNHWPSKYGGAFETEPKRMFAASFLRKKVDSLFNINGDSHIVITGDFNDEPEEESMTESFGMELAKSELGKTDLYNLMYDIRFKTGTHSFQNKWSIIDQFIVSANLMNRESSTRILNNTAIIFDMEWLIMEGATGAKRPFRTYQGPKYIGGYSDHLPIYLDLILRQN
jgi:predicted extracellular nuclease